MSGPYVALWRRLGTYFRAYGGWLGILQSPLFHASLVIAAWNYSRWLEPDWVETAQTLIPSLLGFSLGMYAILFSLISNRLRAALRAAKTDGGVSYLDMINATFFHFIFIQVSTLIWAIMFSGTLVVDALSFLSPYVPYTDIAFNVLAFIGAFIGYVLLIYSLLLSVAAALAIYRLASIHDRSDDQPH